MSKVFALEGKSRECPYRVTAQKMRHAQNRMNKNVYIYIYIYVYSETQKAVKINDTDTNVRPKTIHFLLSIFCQSTHDTFEIVYQTIGIHLCHVSQ